MSTARVTNLQNEASSVVNLALDASGNVTIGNNLTVTGTTTQTGVVVLPAGAVGAPSLTTTGDTDTGIFFPAANTLAFATNGTEDARFDSVGNLLLNSATLSPTQTAAGSIAMPGTLAMGSSFLRNRIINGDMRIDQRAATLTLSSVTGFTVDRFSARLDAGSGSTAAQSTTAPSNFVNSLLLTIGTGASPTAAQVGFFQQPIEGVNIADLGWGTSAAKSVTLSFWVRSSQTGNFGVSVRNSAVDRCYVAQYTISADNTWEYKTITITAPDNTVGGTWLTDTGVGIYLTWDIGEGSNRSTSSTNTWLTTNTPGLSGGVKLCATSGATLYITGVQLEVGSVATPFERRQYGQELALCQRYYNYWAASQFVRYSFAFCDATNTAQLATNVAVPMRAAPSMSITNMTLNGTACTLASVNSSYSVTSPTISWTVSSSGLTVGSMVQLYVASGTTGTITFSSEL